MEAIVKRRSIRKYTEKSVSKEDIDKIIQAGILAPSAKNRQPWKYIVFTEKSKNDLLNEMEKGLIRERDDKMLLPRSHKDLSDAFHTLKIMREAPVIIMIENINGKNPFRNIDSDDRITEICDTLSIGASVQNMLLAAAEMGYGSLWIANTFFAYDELASYIKISGQLVGAVSLGYPGEQPNPRPRKNISDISEYR